MLQYVYLIKSIELNIPIFILCLICHVMIIHLIFILLKENYVFMLFMYSH